MVNKEDTIAQRELRKAQLWASLELPSAGSNRLHSKHKCSGLTPHVRVSEDWYPDRSHTHSLAVTHILPLYHLEFLHKTRQCCSNSLHHPFHMQSSTWSDIHWLYSERGPSYLSDLETCQMTCPLQLQPHTILPCSWLNVLTHPHRWHERKNSSIFLRCSWQVKCCVVVQKIPEKAMPKGLFEYVEEKTIAF